MVEACERAGVPLMVHENFRFQSPMMEIKRVLESGVLGGLTWARLTWRTGYDVYKGQPYLAQEKRFLLLDLGIHVLDLARFLLGEVRHLTCETQSIKPGIAGEDMATVLLRQSGVSGPIFRVSAITGSGLGMLRRNLSVYQTKPKGVNHNGESTR